MRERDYKGKTCFVIKGEKIEMRPGPRDILSSTTHVANDCNSNFHWNPPVGASSRVRPVCESVFCGAH